jgi:hypothetical protein
LIALRKRMFTQWFRLERHFRRWFLKTSKEELSIWEI